MRPSLVAHAPTRLDFGGGWTDVPPYPEERGGFVCNLAIERRAIVRLDYAVDGIVHNETSALIRAACNTAGITNARAQLSSDFPIGAGLGGSSAAGVALAAALAHWNRQTLHQSELAEWSRAVEVQGLQVPGGRQDHYAAAYGGALALTFRHEVQVEQIALSEQTVSSLESQCLLLYTGESRISGETITAVLDAYAMQVPRVINALQRMKELAIEMAHSLRTGGVDSLGVQIGEHWKHQRSLHPRISTERIDAIEKAAYQAGALGMKALGASGGGCVIVFAQAEATERVAQAISGLAERLDWRIAHSGVSVREELPLPNQRATR
ncbi:MAG: hypothetical protein ABJB66_05505 [Gemmatimonadaceae bacterium]